VKVFFISVINQLDAQNFCFTISLFNASTCFEHMCSKHVEALNKLIVKQKCCASNWLNTEMHGQQNVKICSERLGYCVLKVLEVPSFGIWLYLEKYSQ